jgi:hypothetical protein
VNNSVKEEFRRLRHLHARLHDPVALGGAGELIPQEVSPPAAAAGGGAITVDPALIACRLDMFFDQAFEMVAPRARKVELWWWQAGGDVRHAELVHGRSDSFTATVVMEDADYLFAYKVDGRFTPDRRYAQRLLLSRVGVVAPLRLARYGRMLTLRNVGEADCAVQVESNVRWLAVEAMLILPAGGMEMVPVRLLPELMSLGENHGALGVYAGGVEQGGERQVFSLPVSVNLTAGGAVPTLDFSPRDLGPLLQGREQSQLEAVVEVRGRGPLHGMVMISHTSEFADFQLEVGDEPQRFSHAFTIDSSHLPCRERGSVTVTLITDCYLADRRLFKAEVPYSLTYLRKFPQVINFGAVPQGSTKTVRLEVERSDGEEIELGVSVPESVSPHLEYHLARPGVCVFRLRTNALDPGTLLAGNLILTDRRSGLQDRINFTAKVVSGAAGSDGREARASTVRS